MKCEMLEFCIFYQQKMPADSGMGSIYRRTYCETDNSKCARYMVLNALGKEFVPVDLYPNMYQKAESIINQNKDATEQG